MLNYRQQHAPPVDWQEFERFCLALWRPQLYQLQRNGRSGQRQSGVDIYGYDLVTRQEITGIQCKHKNKLSTKELRSAITDAKLFNPPLSRLIIATTAQRDSKLQEWIRIKNKCNRHAGSFGVELYSWEDISELISEPDFFNRSARPNEKEAQFLEDLDTRRVQLSARQNRRLFVKKRLEAVFFHLTASFLMLMPVSQFAAFVDLGPIIGSTGLGSRNLISPGIPRDQVLTLMFCTCFLLAFPLNWLSMFLSQWLIKASSFFRAPTVIQAKLARVLSGQVVPIIILTAALIHIRYGFSLVWIPLGLSVLFLVSLVFVDYP